MATTVKLDSMRLIPNAADITQQAVEYIGREGWGASGQDDWLVLLFDAEGDFLTLGQASTACQAAAGAWAWTWHPCGDEDWDGVVPEFKPGDYRLEVFPPGTWDESTWAGL
jgi:hypothetical protein